MVVAGKQLQSSPAVMEDWLFEHIARAPHARASFKQLVRELGAKGARREQLEEALRRLTQSGRLIELRSGHYVINGRSRQYLAGRLSVHRDGYAFVIPDERPEWLEGDVYIPRESAAQAMHGDRVVAHIVHLTPEGRAEGVLVRVLKRAHPTVVGEFVIRRRGCYVRPHDERIQQWILIPEGMELPPLRPNVNRVGVQTRPITSVEELDGMIVNVEVLDYDADGDLVGRVIEVLGWPDDFGVDVEIIIRKFHIPHEFPPEVLEQAQRIPATIPEDELRHRRDFRQLDVVTIDGETARDFDDAVWVNRLPSGNYQLHVHIADVSHYVKPGTPIDQEAALRGTSVYFPDRAVPMLPVELSTDICSLRPQVDRLVLSVLLEISPQGEVLSREFVRGVIRSAERMTYTNVFRLLEGDEALRQRYALLVERFECMRELALILKRKRDRRGSIDFDLPEPLIEFDTQGEMTGISRTPRNIAHRIIEEFMLAANEAVAAELQAAEFPMIYRIHEPPDPKRVLEFEEIAASYGYSLGIGAIPVKRFHHRERRRDGGRRQQETVIADERLIVPSRHYQRLIRQLEGKPEERILNYLMLRSLRQARYSEDNMGHYALAAPVYTHFTSPIRRYPDLMVHRMLSDYLDRRPPSYTVEELRAIAGSSSETERRADEAERELVEWKKAKFMETRVGEEFNAMIISTTRFGFFIELEDLFIEGLVPIDTLPGDRYRFHESVRKIIGERSRREFSIGDKVRVMLDRVDAVERKLQFSLVEPAPARTRRRKIR